MKQCEIEENDDLASDFRDCVGLREDRGQLTVEQSHIWCLGFVKKAKFLSS